MVAGSYTAPWFADPATFIVTGDSTANGYAEVIGQDQTLHTRSGAGYQTTGIAGVFIPTAPTEQPVAVMCGSVWDVGADPIPNYSTYTDFYVEQGCAVIWVEVPHFQDGFDPGPFPDAEVDAHNARMAAELGGPIQPWSYRVATTIDGLHQAHDPSTTVVIRLAGMARDPDRYRLA